MAMPYLTLNGVSTATALPNAVITALPVWRMARKIYHSEVVSERDGQLFLGSTTFDNYSATVRLNVPASDLGAVFAFFSDGGWTVTSVEPGVKVYVRVLQDAQVTRYAAGDADVTITLDCEPIKRITPDASNITITSSGTTIANPGTYFSLPKVTITGNGEITLNIGADSVHFENVPGGIVVDSELMDAISTNGTELLNDLMDGDPWRIQPGTSIVSWEGNVTRVVIEPRWRCL